MKQRRSIPLTLLSFALVLAGPVTAQTLTTLHNFPAVVNYTNSDGATPYAGLILSGNTLYGTAYNGGSSGCLGTVFAINTDGTGFTNLHNLNTSSDGSLPYAGLILSGNTLYGTTTSGGPGSGTVFAVNTDGSGFTKVHTFPATSGQNSDGAIPYVGLVLSGNTLYGTANKGGDSAVGTVFAVNTDGMGFTNLHNFNGGDGKGVSPYAGLILSGNTLYGTTMGPSLGTVFAMNTDGTGFTNLHRFNALDGATPYAGLILSSNTLYGTTYNAGPVEGTVFAVNTDGTGFTNLHSFTPTSISSTNSDGAHPYAGLILSDRTLYGTTTAGGSSGKGTVFAVNTDGTGFTNLHSFTVTTSGTNSDGATPYGGLVLSGYTLYGTTTAGGSSGKGTVFSLSFRPQLTIVPSETNLILTWPTNYAGFDYAGFTLQSTTNLGSSAVWNTNSTPPVVIGGQNEVINTISGKQQFYRLSQRLP